MISIILPTIKPICYKNHPFRLLYTRSQHCLYPDHFSRGGSFSPYIDLGDRFSTEISVRGTRPYTLSSSPPQIHTKHKTARTVDTQLQTFLPCRESGWGLQCRSTILGSSAPHGLAPRPRSGVWTPTF